MIRFLQFWFPGPIIENPMLPWSNAVLTPPPGYRFWVDGQGRYYVNQDGKFYVFKED